MSGKPSYEELEQRIRDSKNNESERQHLDKAFERFLVPRTQPLHETEGIEFEELFNLEEIQELQDAFAEGARVASIITHPDGTPITKPSNFCRLCEMIIRKTAKGLKNCYHSDAVVGRHNPDGPIVQPCLSGGLWDAGVSITVGGKHIANWLIGQVRNEAQGEEKMLEYAKAIGADVAAFRDAFREVPTMSREQFEKVADAIFLMAKQLSTTAYQTVKQARFITYRKQAEDSLRESERDLEEIVEFSPVGIGVADLEGNILQTNQKFVKLFGYTLEDIPTVPDWFLKAYPDKDYREKAYAIWKRDVMKAQETGSETPPREYNVTCKDGTIRNIEITMKPGRAKHLVTFVDFTERKQAEEALRKSEKRFRDLANNSPNAIAILRVDQYLYVNPSWEDLTGYSKEEAQTLNPFMTVHPDMRDKVHTRAGDRIKGEPVPVRYEMKGINKKGDVVWHDFAATVIEYDNEPAILCITADITDRKRAEEDRERLINELQEALDNIKTLKGLLPICAGCKKIRDDKGYWNQIEGYIERHSHALFSHALCPECMENLYGDEDWYKKGDYD